MKFEDIDQFNFGDTIDNEELRKSHDCVIHISYKHVQLTGQYSFSNIDPALYFKLMQALADRTINDIINNDRHKWHLYLTDYSKNKEFKTLINQIFKNNSNLTTEKTPIFYHISLNPDDETEIARIHFMLGYDGLIFPILYDVNHQICKYK